MKKYFYTDGVSKFGPYSIEELLQKGISRDTKIWFFGLSTWTPINEVEELNQFLLKLPPPVKASTTSLPPLEIPSESPLKTSKKGAKPTFWKEVIIVLAFIIVIFSIWVFVRKKEPKEIDNYSEIVNGSYDSDEDFSMYVDKFYRDLEILGIYPVKPNKVIIKFSNLDKMASTTHIHGISFGYGNDEVIEIYINPSYWKKFNRAQKYFLMYHELSHDILNLDDLDADNVNKGRLMFPNIESYDKITMDEFIESYQLLFEEVAAEKVMNGD